MFPNYELSSIGELIVLQTRLKALEIENHQDWCNYKQLEDELKDVAQKAFDHILQHGVKRVF